ncbi:hypothetical protein GOBAR_AA11444 [Gossypium barbadense]|uniref:Uncharacterized protein n=1 Tax=Gossypium barbadense TaxID=3634 RepID=A0A2P5Y0R5_GOSBA|nr:hypothetical protein GOBAR_AA11444 [Gossypium barbadense]
MTLRALKKSLSSHGRIKIDYVRPFAIRANFVDNLYLPSSALGNLESHWKDIPITPPSINLENEFSQLYHAMEVYLTENCGSLLRLAQ